MTVPVIGSVMGPEDAVDIIVTKQIAAAEDPVAERAKLVETARQSIDPYGAASWAMVDHIIDPAETRQVICNALDAAATKHLERPWHTRGVPPA